MSDVVAKEGHLKDEFSPRLTDDDVERVLKSKDKNAPRVTQEIIQSKIDTIQYMHVPCSTMIICAITMKNGFAVTGESACASPENFDEKLGRKIAYDKAFSKLWELEGYLLKEVLRAAAAVGRDPTDTQAAMGHRAHE